MPQIDEEHLLDVCMSHVKKVGEAAAFAMGPYLSMDASQAVRGGPLGDVAHLLVDLGKVSPTLEFKYSSLKACFMQVLQMHPAVKDKWPISEHANVPKNLADAVLVVCNHARRISRDNTKFAEACAKLNSYQVEKLEAIRALVNHRNKHDVESTRRSSQKKETEEKETAAIPSPKKKAKKRAASPATSSGSSETWSALQALDIPATQTDGENSLLNSAKKSAPVPARKAVLREKVAQSKGFKRPAADLVKKPASKSMSPFLMITR